MKAMITEIKRFAVHDGDGIRTTVFLKGCPLRCRWCHNPETFQKAKQIAYFAHKCVGCRACGECNVHDFSSGSHVVKYDECSGCGKCVDNCPASALKLYGKEMTVDEVYAIVAEDKLFYDNSGGGVTLSGGECLLYPDFCKELLKMCKQNGISTAVDTCGFVKQESLQAVLPYTDVFLYDMKAYDEDTHIRCTGVSNKLILQNLQFLSDGGARIEVRVPFVPTYNDDQVEKIAYFVKSLKGITKVKVLPYHPFAQSKWESIGLTYGESIPVPTKEQIALAQAEFD